MTPVILIAAIVMNQQWRPPSTCAEMASFQYRIAVERASYTTEYWVHHLVFSVSLGKPKRAFGPFEHRVNAEAAMARIAPEASSLVIVHRKFGRIYKMNYITQDDLPRWGDSPLGVEVLWNGRSWEERGSR